MNREDQLHNTNVLTKVHDELKGQGVASMADAYKGVNETNRIVKSDGKLSNNAEPILMQNGVPVVSSTNSTITNPLTEKDAVEKAFTVYVDQSDPSKNTSSIKLLNG